MNEQKRKKLLEALIKDRDETRAALNYIKSQKQHGETLYWESGVIRETTRFDDSQLRRHADVLFMRHEQTLKAYFSSQDSK